MATMGDIMMLKQAFIKSKVCESTGKMTPSSSFESNLQVIAVNLFKKVPFQFYAD